MRRGLNFFIKRKAPQAKLVLISFAFITGNSSLESLFESLLSQIHMDLSSRFSAGIKPGTSG